MEGVKGIQLNVIDERVEYNYSYFPIVVDEKVFGVGRNEVFDELSHHGIGARKYFYPLTSAYAAFRGQFDPAKTPIALWVSERVITLPLYEDLPYEEVDRICEVIKSCGKA